MHTSTHACIQKQAHQENSFSQAKSWLQKCMGPLHITDSEIAGNLYKQTYLVNFVHGVWGLAPGNFEMYILWYWIWVISAVYHFYSESWLIAGKFWELNPLSMNACAGRLISTIYCIDLIAINVFLISSWESTLLSWDRIWKLLQH